MKDWNRESYLAARDREHVLACLEAHDWNQSATARALGISREALFRIRGRHGIEIPARLKRHGRVGRAREGGPGRGSARAPAHHRRRP